MRGLRILGCVIVAAAWCASARGETLNTAMFERDNLVAWCIVPFDAKQRGPEARAEMLTRMGIFKLAYDWRAEHIPTFDEEIETLKRWGITLQAFWFPGALNDEAKAILDALKRHEVKTELWVSMHGGEIACTPEEHAQRVADHVAALRPIVDAAAELGCTVGLYNHGGWFGEPENELEILEALGASNVGLVYNLHHGHGHLDRFAELLEKMKPHLLSLNLNGMVRGGEEAGQKIVPLGNGELDLELLRIIAASGYDGPIGVLGHTMDDAEETLLDNLDGLEWLVAQLKGESPGPRPPLRVGREEEAHGVPSFAPEYGKALAGSLLAEGNEAYRTPPITVECRARLHSWANYNILIASDTKASGAHWEIFTEAGSGELSVYMPGYQPDHVRSGKAICDDAWHRVAMQFEPERVRLYLDGALIADQTVTSKGMPVTPGALGIGRLVEGVFRCDGEIDEVRISRGVREVADAPVVQDEATIALWTFDDLADQSAAQQLEIEDPVRRAALPPYQVIPAADPASLAEAIEPPSSYYTTWNRSHGDNHNTRFAAAEEITRDNVAALEVAWVYRSGDGPGNVQCNPIVVDGVMYAPTSGRHVVAVDARDGNEIWRFKPEGKPAFRGLTYWEGDGTHGPRLYFPSGEYLYALDPASGLPVESFAVEGRIAIGEARVAPAIYRDTIIVPLFLQDVAAFDVVSGEARWTFHTIPGNGEYGRDTWEEPEEGANCWGGMALDEARGIAYVSTGSPKPNFSGNNHWGQNLFSNCVIALDARTGERLWHFQELRHDIWDLDIPAPPNLLAIEWDGRKVDVVAQTTKLGNTLVLDRVTGAPLFPFVLRRAPVSPLPGERTWPYQPDARLPEPFARQQFTIHDVTDRTPAARAAVLARLENARYGWFETFEENVPTALYGFHGGAEWTGAAVDPTRGRLYVSANNVPWIVTVFEPDAVVRDPKAPPTRGELVYREHCMECHGKDRFGVGMYPPLQGLGRRHDDASVRALLTTGRTLMPPIAETVTEEDIQALLDYIFLRDIPEGARQLRQGPKRYTHNGYPKLLDDEGYPGCKPPWGTLNCLDLSTGRLLWQVPLGVYPDLAEWGIDDTGAENFGGPTVTAGGVVFCAGTPDLMIRAFDADTGAVLWEHALPYGGYAPPTVYESGGRQYVLIPATGGGKLGTEEGDAYVAFALGGASSS